MDVSSIAALATDMATTRTQQAAQIAVLKKAMEMEGQGAMQLVQAAAQVSSNISASAGQGIDTFA